MNISAININKSDDAYQSASINVKSNTEKTTNNGIGNVFQNTCVSGVSSVENAKLDSNTYSSLLEDTSTVEEQLKTSAETAKNSLKALVKRLSGADCVEIDKDGFDLNNAEPEEIVTVVDRIKIMLATYCDDYQVLGSSIDKDKIESVVGSTGMANEVAQKMTESNVPATEDNITEATEALDQAGELTPLSENAKNYLVSNSLEPTIENIYKAEHLSFGSSNYKSTAIISNEEWSRLQPQVEQIISDAGLEVNDNNIQNAKTFIENGIPVTKENLAYMEQLDSLNLVDMKSEENQSKVLEKIVDNMLVGGEASATSLVDNKTIYQTVANAIHIINTANAKETMAVTASGQTFNIENLREVIACNIEETSEEDSSSANNVTASLQMDLSSMANYIQLQEIRIRMTADAGLALVKQGFNLDTTAIVDLVEELKQMQEQMAKEVLGDSIDSENIDSTTKVTNQVESTKSIYFVPAQTVIDVKKVINAIKNAPDVTIGAVMKEKEENETVTIADFAEMGNSLKQKFEQAGQTYKAVGTEVRTDLGDSFSKAVNSSTDTILEELGLENTQANRDAVRILGYNEMEITKDNIQTIKKTNSTLNNLINNMKPETVLKMIRDHINPMDADIHTVNQYLEEQNENIDTTEKYTKFLYKLDKTDGISEDERSQFIGVYKMINIFQKDSGNAVGTLVKQNSEITMSNLMTAYNSRKASGIDASIDETTGIAEVTGVVNYYHTLFSATADNITPKTLKTVNEETAIMNRSVENFCEAVNEAYDSAEEVEYYNEYVKELKNITDAEESVIRGLTDNGQQITINTIAAAQNVMMPGYFAKVYGIADDDTKKILDTVVDEIEDSDKLDEAYDNLSEQCNKLVNDVMKSENTENQTYDDINSLRMLGKEIGLIKNLSLRHEYKIPFNAEGEIGTINLSLVQDEEDKGRISIRVETEALGSVSVEAKVSGESIGIFAVTDGDSELLKVRLESVTESLKSKNGLSNCNVYVGSSKVVPDISYHEASDSIATKSLYQIAKTMIIGVIK